MKIQKAVSGNSPSVQTVESERLSKLPYFEAPSSPAASSEFGKLPFSLRVLRIDELPEASVGGRKMVSAIRERGQESNRLYCNATLLLAIPTSLVWFFQIGSNDVFIPLFCTLMFVFHDRYINFSSIVRSLAIHRLPQDLQNRQKGVDSISFERLATAMLGLAWMIVAILTYSIAIDISDDFFLLGFVLAIVAPLSVARPSPREVTSIRPLLKPLLCILWGFAITTTVVFVPSSEPFGWVVKLAALFLGPAVAYWVSKQRARLTGKYLVPLPLRLLSLRVFGSPFRAELGRVYKALGLDRSTLSS